MSLQAEASLDLFTEQCFSPAFGQLFQACATLLVDQGDPPEEVLLESLEKLENLRKLRDALPFTEWERRAREAFHIGS